MITFELEKDTRVLIKLDGERIGDMWASGYDRPHPQWGEKQVENSVQICGFSEASPVWDCARFIGKDCCLLFKGREKL